MFDVIIGRHTWNCQIRTHIHTERETHTHTKKTRKKGEKRRCNDNQQITVTHFGENRRLHLESSKKNYYIISLWVIIKAIFIHVKWDERKKASAQIGLNWQRVYWRFVTRRYRSLCWMRILFIIAHTRNNVVVLFGTLKVQSFMLTEVRDCDLLIVVTSSTFLKRKDMLKGKSS